MDDIAIWDTALSASQISDLYNDGDMVAANNFASSNLKAYYDFEDDSSNDKSVNEKHPNIQAFVTIGSDDGAGTGGYPQTITQTMTLMEGDLSNFALM